MRREVSGFLRVDLIVVLTQRLAGQCSVSGVWRLVDVLLVVLLFVQVAAVLPLILLLRVLLLQLLLCLLLFLCVPGVPVVLVLLLSLYLGLLVREHCL
jgi:NhaP-type Na+/H+ or K+/H+ antiporter